MIPTILRNVQLRAVGAAPERDPPARDHVRARARRDGGGRGASRAAGPSAAPSAATRASARRLAFPPMARREELARARETVAVVGGSGALGFGLALRWAIAGVPVVIGSRDEERAAEAAEGARAGARARSEPDVDVSKGCTTTRRSSAPARSCSRSPSGPSPRTSTICATASSRRRCWWMPPSRLRPRSAAGRRARVGRLAGIRRRAGAGDGAARGDGRLRLSHRERDAALRPSTSRSTRTS